jgi:predicted small integral membrane protein
MMVERGLKIMLAGGVAFLCAFIVIGNLHDPAANQKFVQHVLSMDTIPLDNPMRDHALRVVALWRSLFWLIVAGEVLTAALFIGATVEMWRARNLDARAFHRAKRLIFAGTGCAFLIWFVGFTAIGGEWFDMWESPIWNGQQAAFRFSVSILVVLIFVAQPDAEL